MGFGFVAGSEKPVIVRCVTEGGPSENKLLPGDQILKINGEDVLKAPRERVIELVRTSQYSVILTVCQPYTANGDRKSALLSAAKKARLKNKPSRVRFAEGITINGSLLFSSHVPFLPNVLKVYLENGHMKSFKFDSTTVIQDVLVALQEKLSIKCIDHFCLVLEHVKSAQKDQLTLLNPQDNLLKVACRPGARHLRCLFRMVFVPKDAYELLHYDPIAFEYLYAQCCNDVVLERFSPQLGYDVALRLAALHVQEHLLSIGHQRKMSLNAVEQECGLERFVSISLLESVKRKEICKLLSNFIKQSQILLGPVRKPLTSLQAKLQYLRILGEAPGYGSKFFFTNFQDSRETALLVSPRFGISYINGFRSSVVPVTLAHIEETLSVTIMKLDELSCRVELCLTNPKRESLKFSLDNKDTQEFVLFLRGYYALRTSRRLPVHWQVADMLRVECSSFHHDRPLESHCLTEGNALQNPTVSSTIPKYLPCQDQKLNSSPDETFTGAAIASVCHNMSKTPLVLFVNPNLEMRSILRIK